MAFLSLLFKLAPHLNLSFPCWFFNLDLDPPGKFVEDRGGSEEIVGGDGPLAQEDWNIVLFSGMQYTSHWAALYFVALMTFGNYVLFNLLVAILVEGFSNQVSNQ